MPNRRMAVLGAGTMGRGIAQLFAAHGCRTAVYDPHAHMLETAQRHIHASLALVSEQEEGPSRLEESERRLTYTTDLAAAVEDADWVIEAAPEDAAVKRELFGQLAPLLKADAAVASNTSTFALAALAAEAPFADRLIIAHFFNPAPFVPLVEIVRLPGTRDGIVADMMALLRACGKAPVLLRKDVPGFIANRLQAAVMREACHLLDSGVADAEQIDTAMKEGIGLRWALSGPFEVADYGGLDIWEKVTGHLFPQLDTAREAPESIRGRVREGRLGAKSGSGFYAYSEDAEQREGAARERERTLLRLLRSRRPN